MKAVLALICALAVLLCGCTVSRPVAVISEQPESGDAVIKMTLTGESGAASGCIITDAPDDTVFTFALCTDEDELETKVSAKSGMVVYEFNIDGLEPCFARLVCRVEFDGSQPEAASELYGEKGGKLNSENTCTRNGNTAVECEFSVGLPDFYAAVESKLSEFQTHTPIAVACYYDSGFVLEVSDEYFKLSDEEAREQIRACQVFMRELLREAGYTNEKWRITDSEGTEIR